MATEIVPLLIQVLAYLILTLIFSLILYKKHKLHDTQKTKSMLLAAIGIVLLWVDVVETLIGYEYEGNPLLTILSPFLSIITLLLSHFGLSIFCFLAGRRGRSPDAVAVRYVLAGFDIFLGIGVVVNIYSLYVWFSG